LLPKTTNPSVIYNNKRFYSPGTVPFLVQGRSFRTFVKNKFFWFLLTIKNFCNKMMKPCSAEFLTIFKLHSRWHYHGWSTTEGQIEIQEASRNLSVLSKQFFCSLHVQFWSLIWLNDVIWTAIILHTLFRITISKIGIILFLGNAMICEIIIWWQTKQTH
jgi:hypothetical protein